MLIEMKCLRFRIETPYLANFRNPFSTITILSYPFPPYTTIRGLLANSLGLERDDYHLQDIYEISIKPINIPERTQNIVLMKKLKSNLTSQERRIIKKLRDHRGDITVLDEEELKIYNDLKVLRSTSAPFVKELITPIECIVFVLGENADLIRLKSALENPLRPLYIGTSDDFVIISDIEIVDAVETKSESVNSIIRINRDIGPINKKKVIGRIPYKFNAVNAQKKDYTREDAIVAAPKGEEKIILNGLAKCYMIEGDHIAF